MNNVKKNEYIRSKYASDAGNIKHSGNVMLFILADCKMISFSDVV